MAKVRTGFVSNSSSSSFIIKPKSKDMLECENCKKILSSFFEIKNARQYVENDLGYNSYQDFLNEGPDEDSILYQTVKNDEQVLYARVEYGEERPYYRLLNLLQLEYEED